MNKQNNGFCFLLECCQIVPNSDIRILESTSTPSGVPKIAYKSVLQTLGDRNKNGRYYSHDIGREIVETLKPKAKGRSLFQEVDHPMVSGDTGAKRRAVTVEMKNCGALIRDIYVDGDKIIGEVETLSGFLGPDMYNLIVHDKADIGNSLRMFGRVEMEGATGVAKVVKPIRPITYDIVTNPSHAKAKRIEFLPEGIGDFVTQSHGDLQILNEAAFVEDDLEMQDVNESVYDYADRVIQHVLTTMGPIEFRI